MSVLLLAGMMFAPAIHAGPTCVAPALSDDQIKEIIDKERAARTDLPAQFPRYRWEVRRDGCYYVYTEYGLPETPDYNQIFKLNQHGVIVDIIKGPRDQPRKCPDKVLTERDLTAIIKTAREERSDLPSPFAKSRIRVTRVRCLYLYFEYNVPERRGDYQVFTIDPFGELMEFSRNAPY